MMQNARAIGGFTLVELLVGLLVTSILLSAVATLAFAFSSAEMSTDDMAIGQARLRQATVKLTDLIQHCRLLCAAPGTDLVVWRADDNDNNQINVRELVYLEVGVGHDRVRLAELVSPDDPEVTLAELALTTTKAQLALGRTWRYTPLIPDCNNVQINFHGEAPPCTRLLTVSFDLAENDMMRSYEITAALRAWAGHLLSDANEIVASDDD